MVVDEEPKGAKKHLLHATEQSLYAGIDAITGDGTRVGDISAGVEVVLKKAKLGIIRELVGHGVGLSMHMEPDVANRPLRKWQFLQLPHQNQSPQHHFHADFP